MPSFRPSQTRVWDLVLAHRQRDIGAVPERLDGARPARLHALCSTCQRVWPSTPAVFDPRLRFTRSHATSNVAGSQSRLNRSPKRLLLVLCCPAVQLGLPSQYPLLAPARRRAARAYSRPTSRTASHAAVLLPPFPMWTAFPSSEYYDGSVTPPAHQRTSRLAGPPPAARRARGASHVHHDPFDRVGRRLYPYSPSAGHSQCPVGHRARTRKPGVERAAVN